MPGDPIEMPSETVSVLNTILLPPAALAPSAARPASLSMCILQGVTMLQVDAMAICGRVKSSSSKPTARSMARLGALSGPSTTTLENGLLSLSLFIWVCYPAVPAGRGRRGENGFWRGGRAFPVAWFSGPEPRAAAVLAAVDIRVQLQQYRAACRLPIGSTRFRPRVWPGSRGRPPTRLASPSFSLAPRGEGIGLVAEYDLQNPAPTTGRCGVFV